jgi:hypothetical protein
MYSFIVSLPFMITTVFILAKLGERLGKKIPIWVWLLNGIIWTLITENIFIK